MAKQSNGNSSPQSQDEAGVSTAADRSAKDVDDAGRESRTLGDRKIAEDREMTEAERLEMFRTQFNQAILPKLPDIPGYHTCYLSTNNPRDTINARMRMGYVPVRSDEIPGFKAEVVAAGEYAGFIGINEMVAFKLPENLYQMYMKENHHDAPMREQGRINAVLDEIQERAARHKSYVSADEGLERLRDTSAPAPYFD